jgi:hypothetical protein
VIISHRHRYLFVELPHTASTAISRELQQNYDGQPILRKHAYYHEFLRIASDEEKTFFVFSGIRNPLDEAVSLYFKFKTDHGTFYTKPKHRKDQGGHVTDAHMQRYRFISQTGAGFPEYMIKFHRMPYDNWSSLAHHTFDHIIRFEELQEGFSRVLELLGIEQKRPLPAANVTDNRQQDFLRYCPRQTWKRAVWVFGPFMERWGYEFPHEWGDCAVPLSSRVLYRALAIYRNSRRKYLRSSGLPLVQSIDRALERLSLWRHRSQ